LEVGAAQSSVCGRGGRERSNNDFIVLGVRQHSVRLTAIVARERGSCEIENITLFPLLNGVGARNWGGLVEGFGHTRDRGEGMRVKTGLFILRADLKFVVVSVEGEAGFVLNAGPGSVKRGVNFSLDGGSAVSDDPCSIKGVVNFVLDFTTSREEAAFEEFLSVEVDGVFRNFTTDNMANVGAEIGVKGGGPGCKVWVKFCDSMGYKRGVRG